MLLLSMSRRKLPAWQPSEEQMQLWPSVSGNTINGTGESLPRRPKPIYWHAPDATPHGKLQPWFYARTANQGEELVEARRERQLAIDEPLVAKATAKPERSAASWSELVKRVAREVGADDVGIAAMKPDYVFEGEAVPTEPWMVVLALGQDYDAMKTAPSVRSLVEVTRQYARGTRTAKAVANWLRAEGHDALPYGGPMAGSFLLIPPAIEAGLGELGKHGSMIHRAMGSSFRLACVLTDAPLLPDRRDALGASDFCTNCRVCADACPPDAILPEKRLVRGEVRWYVDFDKCLPYFNENLSCAICLAVCPFSRPIIGPRLVEKLGRREKKAEGERR